jgi:hypothetical protein
MLEDMMIDSDKQGLTEAWLAEEFGWDKPTPPPLGRGQQRETIAWFMDRQVGGAAVWMTERMSHAWCVHMQIAQSMGGVCDDEETKLLFDMCPCCARIISCLCSFHVSVMQLVPSDELRTRALTGHQWLEHVLMLTPMLRLCCCC